MGSPKKRRPQGKRWVAGAAVVLLLSGLLLAGALVAIYVFVPAPPGEKAILGSWEADMEVMRAQKGGLDLVGYRTRFYEGGRVAFHEDTDWEDRIRELLVGRLPVKEGIVKLGDP